MRKTPLVEGEYYHIFNRGVEKRDIFSHTDDLARFLESIREFNSPTTIGSLFENRFRKEPLGSLAPKPLIEIVCYCLNPNHFHLLCKQVSEKGIQKFMQKVGTGYTNYFNEKYHRSGSLFQGTYKAVHIESNEQLLHTSVYVNLNNQLGSLAPKLSASSWPEYAGMVGGDTICKKEILLEQFQKTNGYETFARETLLAIVETKRKEKEMQWLLGS